MGESADENVYNNNKSKSYDIFFFLFLVKEIKRFSYCTLPVMFFIIVILSSNINN